LTQGKAGQENRNVIKDLLPMAHISDKASQKRHEPGLLRPRGRAIWGKGKISPRSSQMAQQSGSQQQGGATPSSPQQQQGQQSSGSTQQAGQPIFRDWASI
jgi:hypothetical protein